MLDANPNLTVTQVRSIIQQTAVDWGTAGQDVDYGWGRLDTYAAVRTAGNFSKNAPPAIPGHAIFSGTLAGTGAQVQHTFNVNNTAYPINVTLLLPDWTSSNSPDFDLYVYNPDGSEMARSTGTTRQEQVTGKPTQSGTYKLLVKSYSGSGSYVADVSAGLAAQSNQPPSVSVAQPGEGDTVSGTVTVKVTATDDVQVAKVELQVDGGGFADITGNFDGTYYTYSWDTTGLANGSHTLTARATDSAGAQSTATRTVDVQNQQTPPTAQHEITRTGQVTSASKDATVTFTVTAVGYVDLRLDWATTADLDLYVYAPDGTQVGRAYTLNNPERMRVDTVKWGTGTYTARVNLFSGPNTAFTLTADGYQRDVFTDAVSPASPNSVKSRVMNYTGKGLVVLSWPGSSDLDFFVYNPANVLKAKAYTLNNPEQANVVIDATGTWSVKVNLYSGPGAGYTLSIFAPEAVLI